MKRVQILVPMRDLASISTPEVPMPGGTKPRAPSDDEVDFSPPKGMDRRAVLRATYGLGSESTAVLPGPIVLDRDEGDEEQTIGDSGSVLRKKHSLVLRRNDQRLMLQFGRDREMSYQRKSFIDLYAIYATYLESAMERMRPKKMSASGVWLKRSKMEFGALQIRDLRRLDPEGTYSSESCILVRKFAVLVNLDQIRALILPDVCFLVLGSGVDSMLEILRYFISSNHISYEFPAEPSNGSIFPIDEYCAERPFELFALEVLFETLCGVENHPNPDRLDLSDVDYSLLGRENALLRREVIEVDRDQGATNMEELRQIAMESSKFKRKITAIRRVLKELLESDSDMALMQISKVLQDPMRYNEERLTDWSWDHEDIETLIAAYFENIDQFRAKAKDQNYMLKLRRGQMVLTLDSARNRLLRIDLYFSVITAMAGIGALGAGIFGMNLNSHIQEADGVFWSVSAALCFGPLLIGMFFLIIAEKRRWLIS